MKVTPGSSDVTTYFVLRLAATGVEATGLTITNFDLQYTRSGVAPAAKVDATALAATDSAHGDNQAIEIDATDQPGLYRVDWPDAAFAAGVREVILTVKCATVFTEHLRVELETLQTGDSFARLGAPAGASVSADLLVIDNLVDDLESRLGTPSNLGGGATVAANLADIEGQTDDIGTAGAGLTALATAASIAALNNLSAAQVNAEVVDALTVDVVAQPGQEAPAASQTIAKILAYLYKGFRNKVTQDGTTFKLYADDASTVDHKSTISDSGSEFTRGELGSGP